MKTSGPIAWRACAAPEPDRPCDRRRRDAHGRARPAQGLRLGTYRPSTQVYLSVGEGQLINLPRTVANVWTSNPKVADVYVSSPRR